MDDNVDSSLGHLFLVFDILLAVIVFCSLIGNGFILTVIASRPSLWKNEGIYLFSALSLADFILALTIIPYITLLIWYWDTNPSYPATLTLLFSLPIVIEIKINLVLTVAIALDRFTAIQWPIDYKLKKKARYAIICFLVGTLWAVFDVTLLFMTTTIQPTPGCATAGCFMSKTFRFYWWTSNMFISSIAIAATVLILIKLRFMHDAQVEESSEVMKKMMLLLSHIFGMIGLKTQQGTSADISNIARNSRSEQEKFHRANCVAVSVLLCSGFCILLPNMCAGVGEMVGVLMFQYSEPLVPLGLVLCGFVNTFIYALKLIRSQLLPSDIRSIPNLDSITVAMYFLWLATCCFQHKDIRHAIKVFGVRTVSVSRAESNAGLNFPPGVADAGIMIQALRMHEMDGVDVMPQNLHRNRISATSDQIAGWFI